MGYCNWKSYLGKWFLISSSPAPTPPSYGILQLKSLHMTLSWIPFTMEGGWLLLAIHCKCKCWWWCWWWWWWCWWWRQPGRCRRPSGRVDQCRAKDLALSSLLACSQNVSVLSFFDKNRLFLSTMLLSPSLLVQHHLWASGRGIPSFRDHLIVGLGIPSAVQTNVVELPSWCHHFSYQTIWIQRRSASDRNRVFLHANRLCSRWCW